jgi:hypothetical protein
LRVLTLSLSLSFSLCALFALLNAECCVAALPDLHEEER